MREIIKELVGEIGISEIENTLEELKQKELYHKANKDWLNNIIKIEDPFEQDTSCCYKSKHCCFKNWFYDAFNNVIKSEKCSCDNNQRARDWFHNYLMGVSIYKKEGYPESLFFKNKNGVTIMQQCFITDLLYVYDIIWLELKSYFDLNDKDVKHLIQDMVSEHFKIKVGKPLETIPTPYQMKGRTKKK